MQECHLAIFAHSKTFEQTYSKLQQTVEIFLRNTTDLSVTDVEFNGNLTCGQALAALSTPTKFLGLGTSSSTRAMFVSECEDLGRPLPALRSVAEPL